MRSLSALYGHPICILSTIRRFKVFCRQYLCIRIRSRLVLTPNCQVILRAVSEIGSDSRAFSWPGEDILADTRTSRAARRWAWSPRGSVLVLKREEGAANGSGQLRLLPRELESRGELRGDFHPFGQLEPDRPLLGVVDGVHHIDRQAALVEEVRDSDVLDLEGRSLERAGRDDDVAFFLEDPGGAGSPKRVTGEAEPKPGERAD